MVMIISIVIVTVMVIVIVIVIVIVKVMAIEYDYVNCRAHDVCSLGEFIPWSKTKKRMEAITHIEKLIGGSNIHPTMVPFAMVVDSTFGEIDWWQQNP